MNRQTERRKLYTPRYKSLTLDSGKFVDFIQTFGHLVSFSYYLVLVLCILNKILKLLIFSGKIVISLGNNTGTCKNSYSKHFWKPIFKMFAAHFRTKRILNNDKIIFEWGCVIAWWYAKNLLLSFKRCCIQSCLDENYKVVSISNSETDKEGIWW